MVLAHSNAHTTAPAPGRHPRWVFLLVLLLVHGAMAGDGNVLVLYPEAPPPYRVAFAQMLAGLEHSLGTPPHTLELPEHYDLEQIRQWVTDRREAGSTLVVLGQRAFAAAEQLSVGLPLLVGGVTRLPDQSKAPGVSLLIAPTLFVERAQQLLPAVRTIVVVYNARQPALLLSIEQAIRQQSLAVQPVAVSDAADFVRQLSRVFDTVDPRTTALWFTADTLSLNTELLFPFVLEQTWQRRIPAFSETIAHTQRGLLFALYPDYEGVGEELGERIKHATAGLPGMDFTHAARQALNTRTAQHLGLTLRPEIVGQATLVFPAR